MKCLTYLCLCFTLALLYPIKQTWWYKLQFVHKSEQALKLEELLSIITNKHFLSKSRSSTDDKETGTVANSRALLETTKYSVRKREYFAWILRRVNILFYSLEFYPGIPLIYPRRHLSTELTLAQFAKWGADRVANFHFDVQRIPALLRGTLVTRLVQSARSIPFGCPCHCSTAKDPERITTQVCARPFFLPCRLSPLPCTIFSSACIYLYLAPLLWFSSDNTRARLLSLRTQLQYLLDYSKS